MTDMLHGIIYRLIFRLVCSVNSCELQNNFINWLKLLHSHIDGHRFWAMIYEFDHDFSIINLWLVGAEAASNYVRCSHSQTALSMTILNPGSFDLKPILVAIDLAWNYTWITQCISPSVLSLARAQFPTVVECFKSFFLSDHMCCLVHRSGKTEGLNHSWNSEVVSPSVMPSISLWSACRSNLVHSEPKKATRPQ